MGQKRYVSEQTRARNARLISFYLRARYLVCRQVELAVKETHKSRVKDNLWKTEKKIELLGSRGGLGWYTIEFILISINVMKVLLHYLRLLLGFARVCFVMLQVGALFFTVNN